VPHDLSSYLIAAALIFGVNLLPAFSPPTWAVVVFLSVNFELAPGPLVPLAAVAATLGRVVLALGSRRVRSWFSEKRLASLAAAREALAKNPRRLWGTVVFFFVSPLPSSQLFVAAGLLNLPIRQLSLAFFGGRLITYALYLNGAHMVRERFGDVLLKAVTSPLGLTLQLLALAALGLLFAVDWTRVLGRKGG
jgi:membrane protein YqaA with SNARE-associated domain